MDVTRVDGPELDCGGAEGEGRDCDCDGCGEGARTLGWRYPDEALPVALALSIDGGADAGAEAVCSAMPCGA